MADETRKDLLSEKQELELEKLRDEVGRMRAGRDQRESARADNERAFADGRAKNAALASQCNHKKGGRDYAASQKRGDGDNYSVIIHQLPLGQTIVLCTRCLFMWEPGMSATKKKDGTPNPTGISWADAVKFPTDNSPSGSVLFGPRISIPTAA